MKKYRCLWCKSTANHNIWYFLRTSSTSLKNPTPTRKTRPILLWKAQTALPDAVRSGPKLPKIQCIRDSIRDASQSNKPMPHKVSEQEAKQVQISRWLWELWTIGYRSPHPIAYPNSRLIRPHQFPAVGSYRHLRGVT